jgi:hypothetical protein
MSTRTSARIEYKKERKRTRETEEGEEEKKESKPVSKKSKKQPPQADPERGNADSILCQCKKVTLYFSHIGKLGLPVYRRGTVWGQPNLHAVKHTRYKCFEQTPWNGEETWMYHAPDWALELNMSRQHEIETLQEEVQELREIVKTMKSKINKFRV